MNAIVCIGETLTERVQRKTDMVNARMLNAIAEEIDDWSKVSIAYQPVWTINTGRTASHDQVQETQKEVRDWVALNVGYNEADTMRIIYGGAITKFNVQQLIKQPDVDGFLFGAIALKSDFVDLVNSVEEFAKQHEFTSDQTSDEE